ncbi:MAG: hypothetical protein GTO04_02870, partial [Planctomycetales bacterium]|nr:hypothetical protein [Planctomycetales bacterium]
LSLGFGGVLWGEVRGFADPSAIVQSYITGVGGGDVRPEHMLNLIADIEQRQKSGAPQIV